MVCMLWTIGGVGWSFVREVYESFVLHLTPALICLGTVLIYVVQWNTCRHQRTVLAHPLEYH